MKCQKCQFENPEGMKFCGDCGVKLEMTCPKCNSSNPPGFKFCGECGNNLSLPSVPLPKELSFDEKLDKIQRYLPKGLTEKILSQKKKIEGERRHVTVMFCDMEGFTPMVERLGPEEAYSIMDEIYEILIHKVHDYEGTVNEMTGDGIMALFGAPIALEDAPERAVRSSLAIHREMTKFNDNFKGVTDQTLPFRMRIGLHSGPVVVGTLGNTLRVEFKAVGDTVNLASRMESLAEPGTTYVTDEIFSRTEGLFRFEALGEKKVKGREEAVKVYQVIAPRAKKTRFDIRAKRGITPFVGRQRELELLLEAFERTAAGSGQAVCIVAEAGVGKSRLLHEFKKTVANDDVTLLQGQCSSYGQSTPYFTVIDILKDNFRIRREDSPGEMLEKIKKGLKNIEADPDQTLPYILDLFSLENGFDSLTDIDPEVKRRRTFEALREITLRGSQARPLVMVIEDLHWIDKTSEESIRLLIEHIAGARVFLIFTFRPNYLPPWGGKSYYGQIHLNRLSKRESLEIIKALLNAEAVDEDIAKLLLDKAEGVPLFAEEFTRSLKEAGHVIDVDGRCCLKTDFASIRIPGTIHDVLMARVDRLPEDAREILLAGAVIGREFSWDLIEEISGTPEKELLSRLSALKESEIILERGIFPRVNYIFHHAMTQELLYDSMLPAKLKKYHNTIGQAIERLYPDQLEDHTPMLALHFTRGGESEKGYRYHHLAGDRAAASYANREAMEYFREAWRLTGDGSPNLDVKKERLSTVIRLAEVMEPLGEFEPTLALLQEILKESTGVEDPSRYDRIHYWMGNTLGNLGRYDNAREHLFRSLELSQASGNKETEGKTREYLSQLDHMQGYYRRALDHAEASVRCLRNIENPSLLAWALVTKGITLSNLEREDYYKGFLKETAELVKRCGNERIQCWFLVPISMCFVYNGQYEEGEKIALEGIELAKRIGEGILSVFHFCAAGRTALYAGKSDYALDLLQRGTAKGEKIGHPLGLAYIRTFLAEALLRSGRVEEALGTVQAALHFSQALDLGPILQNALEVNAEILAHRDPFDEIRIDEMMEQASALVERGDSPWRKNQYLMARARIGLKRGRIEDVRKDLAEVRAIYLKMGLENGTGELRSIETALKEADV
jgi:class 3 adenylate cyclase/tetratricopeptide (TPR) repeat protein